MKTRKPKLTSNDKPGKGNNATTQPVRSRTSKPDQIVLEDILTELEKDADKPVILLDGTQQTTWIADEAWEAIKKYQDIDYKLFSNVSGLVRIEHIPTKSSQFGEILVPRIQVMKTSKILLSVLRNTAVWYKESRKGEAVAIDPPTKVADEILNRRVGELPYLDAISTIPIYDEQGRLINKPGYNPESKVYYHPTPDLYELNVEKSSNALSEAVHFLTAVLLEDFQFESKSDVTNIIAALIQPFVRRMIRGVTPMYLVTASKYGSGKSLLCKLVARTILATEPGSCIIRSGEPSETDKQITAELVSGAQVVCFDNLPEGCVINHKSLASVLTTEVYEVRKMGTNTDLLKLPNRCLWLANGNDPKFSYDITRRCVHVRLSPKTDRPEDRKDFINPDFEQMVMERRPKIIASVLTLVENWIAMGSPEPKNVKQLGSFGDYRRVVGGIIEAAGITGFLDNQDKFRKLASTDEASWAEAFDAWYDENGEKKFTAGQFDDFCEKNELLVEARGSGTAKSRSTKLGHLLSGYGDNKIAGYTVVATHVYLTGSRSSKKAFFLQADTEIETLPKVYALMPPKLPTKLKLKSTPS